MADPRGFMKYPRRAPSGVRSRSGSRTGTRSTPEASAARCCRSSPSRPDAAWTAASRSATRLPPGQPDPGVERPGLARRLGRGDRSSAQDEQLPRVHRPAVPRAVRDGLRRGHQPRPGDDQERRGLEHRQGLGPAQRQAPGPRVADRQDVAVIGLGPAGLAVAQQLTRRAAHRRGLRARRQAGGLLRYGIPKFQDGEGPGRPTCRPDEARGHGVPHRRPRGETLTGAQLRDRYDAVVLAIARPCAVTCRPRAASSAASTRPWTTCPRQPRGARETVEDQIPGHGQGRRHHRRRRHRCRLPGHRDPPGRASVTSLEIMPQPGEDRPENQPWPTYPMLFRVASAHEEGGERVYSVSTQEFLGRRGRQVRRCASSRSRSSTAS